MLLADASVDRLIFCEALSSDARMCYHPNGRFLYDGRAGACGCMERLQLDLLDSELSARHLVRRLRNAQALHECAQALLQPVAGEADRQQVLTEALAHLRAAAGAGRASLFRNFDDPHRGFCCGMVAESCAAGIPSSLAGGFAACIPWQSVPDGHAAAQAAGLPVGGPTAVVFEGTPLLRDSLLADGILSVQFFPVQVEGLWWGFISFDDYNSAREWDTEELLLQRTAVAMFGGALRRWQVEEQLQAARAAAVLHQERQRLARELHDALTQSVYSMMLFARAGCDALEKQDTDKVRNTLLAVEDTSYQALIEMRLLLLELQPTDRGQGTLQSAFESRFTLIERRLGIQADFVDLSGCELSPVVQDVLLRVAFEALNNTLKHAKASQVCVQLAQAAAALCLTISDNGQGFDPVRSFPGIGSRTMQERAAAVGGRIRVDSSPGRGTQVFCWLPGDPELLPATLSNSS